MKLKEILYSETFPVSSTGHFRKMHIVAEISPDEDVKQCFYELKKKVNEFHYESLGAENKQKQKEEVTDQIQATLDEIEKSDTLERLSSLWLISKANMVLSKAYKEKEKQLNNAIK